MLFNHDNLFSVMSITPNDPFFFFNDTATTEIYTLSLHDALPIWRASAPVRYPTNSRDHQAPLRDRSADVVKRDRKSTRLNSSHVRISYAVFCLKKKKIDESDCFSYSYAAIGLTSALGCLVSIHID